MLLELIDSIWVKVIKNTYLPYYPRWLDNMVMVSPCTSIQEYYERHIVNTVGSFDFFDCLPEKIRFDEKELFLQSTLFMIPDDEMTSDSQIFRKWCQVKPVKGRLYLLKAQNFAIDIVADYRWICPESNIFMGISKFGLKESEEIFRLRIAPDFDLLFLNKRLCGWILLNPERYIVSDFDEQVINQSAPELKILTYEYLKLTSGFFLDKMYHSDPHVYDLLTSLHLKISKYNLAQLETLKEKLEHIINLYYSEK